MAALWACCVLASGACTGFSVQAGYMQIDVGGDFALAEGTTGTGDAVAQDIGTAFGLGSPQGSPYLRARLDAGAFAFTASGFLFEESGAGQLDASFGGLPAATPVASRLEFGCAKLAAVYAFEVGPVTLAPGLAVDVFDLEFRAEEQALGNAEVIDEVIGVPLLFCRAETQLDAFAVALEIGYLDTPRIDSAEGSCLDAELTVACTVLPDVDLFAGYRFIDIDANGDTGNESFGIDLQVRGWVIGGGLRF